MKIISLIDKSTEGNDCYIYEEWLLVALFGKRMIIHNYMDTYFSKLETTTFQIRNEFVDSTDLEVQSMFEALRKKKELES